MASELDTRVLGTVISGLGSGMLTDKKWQQSLLNAKSQDDAADKEAPEDNGPPLADEDTEAPDLGDYKTFAWSVDQKDEAVTITTHDGKEFVVSKEKTPELFAEVQQDMKTWAKIHDLEDNDGYTLRSADDDIPVLDEDDSVESVADDDGNVIEGLKLVTVNGDKYVVAEDITPEHFEAASNFQQISSADAIDDVFAEHDLPSSEDANLMGQETTVENDDGEAMTVTEVYMDKLEQKLDELKTGQQGRHLKVHDNDFYQDNKKAIDTILNNWDKWNGSDDIVSKKDLKKIANGRWSEDEAEAAKFLLDDERSQGLLGMLDTFHKGDGSDGKISSADIDSWMQMIGERPVTEDNPIFERGDEENVEVDNDELVRDVDQATIDKFEKAVRLLKLKSQLDDGSFQYLPYMTVDHGGDWTYYASDTQGMDPADLRGLIDEEKLGAELSELLGDEQIAKFTDEVMTDAQSKIKGRDALADKLYDSLTGDQGAEYLDAIEELRGQGLGDEAATRLNNDLNTLQALDPDRAAEARGSITAASAARDVEGELGEIDAEYDDYQSGGDIPAESEETAEQVATDMLPSVLTSITYSTFAIQTSNGVWNAVKDALSSDKTDPKATVPPNLTADEKLQFTRIMAIAAGVKEILKTAAMSGSNIETALKDSSLMRDVTAKVNEQFQRMTTSRDGQPPVVDLSDSERASAQSSMKSQFSRLMSSNTMFAIGGTVALINAIYRRSGDGFGDTPEERMSIARGMLVFIGVTPFALKGITDAAGSKLDEGSRLAKLFGTPNITQAMGLDKELGDVLRERFPATFNGETASYYSDSLMNPGAEARERLNSVNSDLIELETLAGDSSVSQTQLEQRLDEVIRDANTQLDEASRLSQAESGVSNEEKARIQDGIDRLKNDIDSLQAVKSDASSTSSRESFVTALEDIFYDAQSHLSEFSTNAGPNDILYSQIDDFDRSVGEYRQMLDADGKGKGKMPDGAAELFDGMMEKQQSIRELIENDPTLSDAQRTEQLAHLDDIANRLDDVRPPGDGTIPSGSGDALDEVSNLGDDLRERFDPNGGESSRAAMQSWNQALDTEAESMTGGDGSGGSSSPDDPGSTTGGDGSTADKKKTSIFGPAFKGLAYMTDFAGGILDTVVAGIGLNQAIKNGGDPMALATSSTGVVSGSFFTIGGAAEIGASLQTASRVLSGLGAGLRAAGPIGNLVGLGVGFVSLILNAVMAQKKGAETEGKIRDQFEQLSDDGVTEDDWGEKFNYLINSSYGFKEMMHAGDDDKEPDPLFKEWFPEDMAAWEAQPDQYDKFTQEIEENGNVDDFFFDFDQDKMQLNVHGQAFYQENKDTIDTILTNWDEGDGGSDWTAGDDIVSKKDLEKIADPENGHSKEERDAAQFLLDNEDFFALLDNLHKQDGSDGKISSADIDSWMQLIGERAITDDNPAFADEDSLWDNPASYKL